MTYSPRQAYETGERPENWSADSNPNGINPNGGGYGAAGTTGMHWIDIGVPLFILTADDAATVLARYADSKTPDEPSRETLGVRWRSAWLALRRPVSHRPRSLPVRGGALAHRVLTAAMQCRWRCALPCSNGRPSSCSRSG